ncbi:MAG: hypothetical protein OXH51_01950 [Gemmatimonadetes bacterium]|nr:hypothetical protein [Gemmatimonadota bacterium]MCY3610273.1 hypothetical protein [Gemmatimonadota bacterium]MCY3677138.1 hypothetical protein [Gemmatimonadota bacterium]MYA40654.1 hypothetical protein [Gemmatimonadota bacterium]MYE93725.1 hypothetical protein [Gemmatimonadota bacterium]
MKCPDLRTLSRVGTPNADPAVWEHVTNCESCWLDWQIQQGLRYLEDPLVKSASDVNDQVIARVRIRARRDSEPPARWRDAALFGAVVAIAVLAFLVAVPAAAVTIPVAPAVGYAVAAGVGGALYVKKRDEDRFAGDPRIGPSR